MAGDPDPKPPRRKKDPAARKSARLAADACEVCGRSARLNVHHILYGSSGRHDDPRNFVILCGSGTEWCHGLFHAGDPETVRAVGRAIAAAPEKVAFVEEWLGREAGRDYLRRRYQIELAA